ncbi:Hypothetical protein NGAL_HAMBI490_60330 [Neorhizobium galegae bv. officinalis]|nr:Hypothetical protein NGAL_HAMBI490_60330 [Neorhizobium galegae bv. officinalis]
MSRRRRAPPVDLMSKSTPTTIRQNSNRHPLRIPSPTHSIPGKTPKTFDFTILSAFGDLGHRIALAFVQYNSAAPYVSASSRAVSVRNFFRSVVIALEASSTDFACLGANKWRALAKGWFLQLQAQEGLSDITKNVYLTNCTLFFEYLSENAIVPAFPWPSSIPNAKNHHRPSIAEAGLGSASLDEVKSWPIQDQADWAELQSVAADPSPQARKKRGDITKDVVRRHAEREIRETWHLYCETRTIIESNVTFDLETYCQQFETEGENGLVRKYGWQRELSSLPNVLVYIDRKFGGVLPGIKDDPHFLKFIYKDFGKASMTGRFHLEYESLISLLTIILLKRKKTNFSSPLSMLFTDLEKTTRGEYRAKWTKRRAQNRRLKDDMPAGTEDALSKGSTREITAAQAFLVIDELSQPLRRCAVRGSENALCLVRTFVQQKVASFRPLPYVLNRKWHTFRRRSGVLSKLDFTLSQFRPTAAIEVFRETGDIMKVAEELGQKDVRVTARYVQGLEAEAGHAANTRPVQDALVLAAAKVSGRSAADFGISEEHKKEVLKTAHAAGFFGYNISGTEDEAEVKVSLFEKMLSGVKLFFFETPEVAAEIIAFRQHIIDNGKAIQGTDRFEELWLPILVTCSHVIDSMSPKILKQATSLLLDRPIRYGPVI